MTRDIDSSSVGDAARFLSFAVLMERFAAMAAAPRDAGRVVMLVSRGHDGRRALRERVRLTVTGGMPDDAWGRRTPEHLEAQLAVMQADVAALLANEQPLVLFGDNLFLDLDPSTANLPVGSRLRVGAAVLEVTHKAHNGCRKFSARFGAEALRFVADPTLRPRNLRGIYLRTVEDGEVAVGDAVSVLTRA